MTNLTISQRGVILILVPVFFNLLFVFFLNALLRSSEDELHRRMKLDAVVSLIASVSKLFFEADCIALGLRTTDDALLASYWRKTSKEIELESEACQKALEAFASVFSS